MLAAQVCGFRLAETVCSSRLRRGAQLPTGPRLSGFGVMRISVDPAPANQPSIRSAEAASATQPHNSAGSDFGRQRHDVDGGGNDKPVARLYHAYGSTEHLALVREPD